VKRLNRLEVCKVSGYLSKFIIAVSIAFLCITVWAHVLSLNPKLVSWVVDHSPQLYFVGIIGLVISFCTLYISWRVITDDPPKKDLVGLINLERDGRRISGFTTIIDAGQWSQFKKSLRVDNPSKLDDRALIEGCIRAGTTCIWFINEGMRVCGIVEEGGKLRQIDMGMGKIAEDIIRYANNPKKQ